MSSLGGDVDQAVAARPVIPFSGDAWRVHRARYRADDSIGSTVASGRFHRAEREYPSSEHWRALYLALGPDIPIGEMLRHFGPRPLVEVRLYRRTRLFVDVARVVDCRDIAALGLTYDALLDDLAYDVGQMLGLAAVHQGAEGIVVPSATRAGDNLILFPENLLPASRVGATGDELDLTHFVVD